MPFPYLVTLLILLPFVLFRKHSELVRHNLCGARRRVKWRVRKCAGRWAFLHRISRLRRSLIPTFFVRRGTPPSRSPSSGLRPSVRTAPSMDQPKADLPRYWPNIASEVCACDEDYKIVHQKQQWQTL
jgi:hypothetical protein